MRRRTMIVTTIGAVVLGVIVVATIDLARREPGKVSVAADAATTTTSTTMSVTTTVSYPSPNPNPNPPSAETGTHFESRVSAVTAVQLGSSWHDGCPVPAEQLRAVDVSYWGYDGAAHSGRIIVHEAYADGIVTALRDIYTARFPIERMTPIDAYGGDDQASMRANNTSAFNCRFVAGTTNWSEHAFGRAIDVNPLVNPYVKPSGVDPPEGAPYADRRRTVAGMIHGGDAVVRGFAAQGWRWGGYWSDGKDYQHFSATGR